MRWIELSSPTLVAFISKVPNWFTVPEETSSPTVLSTGRDSPVITAWFTDVFPERITPSTGMVSPGRTRRISSTATSVAATMVSVPSLTSLAVCGVRRTSFSIPARAFATVSSSNKAPNCMINATSPAAKSSSIKTEAISARDTRTSALMSNSVIRPMTASMIMGIPHRIMATQAASNGSGISLKILMISAIPEMTRKQMSFFIPPISIRASSFLTDSFIMAPSFCIIPIGVYVVKKQL